MLKFDPPELRLQIIDAVEEWTNKLDVEPDELIEGIGDLIKEDFDPNEFDDRVITLSTELELYLPKWEDLAVMSYGDFISLTEELRFTELIQNVICRSQKRSLVRVEIVNAAADLLTIFSIPDAENSDEIEIRRELIEQRRRRKSIYKQRTVKEFLDQTSEEEKAEFNTVRQKEIELSRKLEKSTKRFFTQNNQIDECNISCSITTGFTLFGVTIAFEGNYIDEYPPIIDDDVFVEIRFDKQISESLEKSILEAYLFELSSSLNTDFKVSTRPDCEEIDFSYEELEDHNFNPRFRPLLIGKGMADLLDLYNRAIASIDPDVQILYFTKVIEYVSQTVIRRASDEAIRAKLLSPRALQPDASFIIELEKVIKAQQKYEKDKEAIRETVAVCCEAVELARVAPPYLTKLRAILNSKNQNENLEREKLGALKQFGASLYSTRNEVAHAKANYTPSGDECPEDQLTEFANCAKLAAQQVIRWYQLVPESARLP